VKTGAKVDQQRGVSSAYIRMVHTYLTKSLRKRDFQSSLPFSSLSLSLSLPVPPSPSLPPPLLNHLNCIHTYTYHSARIYAPLAYKPPLHFQSKFLHRYFYLANRLPQPWPCYQNNNVIFRRNSYTVKFRVSVVEWQHRKPTSTDQLRNSPMMATVSASGINLRSACKTPPSTLWPTSVMISRS